MRNSAEELQVRPATELDSAMIFAWRNDPATRAVSVTTEEITWSDHQKWFATVLADPDRHLLVAQVAGQQVGVVRFDRVGEQNWEISLNLAPEARGRGRGVVSIKAGHRWLLNYEEPAEILAKVRASNEASLRVFDKAGYVEVSRVDDWVHLVWRSSHFSRRESRRSASNFPPV